MPRSKPAYPPEFNAEAVRLVAGPVVLIYLDTIQKLSAALGVEPREIEEFARAIDRAGEGEARSTERSEGSGCRGKGRWSRRCVRGG